MFFLLLYLVLQLQSVRKAQVIFAAQSCRCIFCYQSFREYPKGIAHHDTLFISNASLRKNLGLTILYLIPVASKGFTNLDCMFKKSTEVDSTYRYMLSYCIPPPPGNSLIQSNLHRVLHLTSPHFILK